MAASFTMPRCDYRLFPFRLTVCRVTQDMQNCTFYFTCKKNITDGDDKILFDKTVVIPAGVPVYSSSFEVLPEDSDLPPDTYWLEATVMKDAHPMTNAPPAVFQITERLRKEF